MTELAFSSSPHPFKPSEALGATHALAHADALLRCASAVAYESADQHKGEARHLALTVVHLVDMARTLVVHGLECTPWPTDAHPIETES